MGADKDIVERLQSAGHFYATPHDAILYEAAAEIVRLRGEVAPNVTGLVDSLIQLRDADWTLNNEPMPDDAQGVLNMAIEAIRNPAPAMPNGVEADWKCIISVLEHGMRDGIHGGYNASYIKQQIKALRAADNRDAAGVCDACGGAGMVGHYAPDGPFGEDCPACAPAAVPAGEAVALPMDTAPRDSTMVRLLVQFDDHATEDTDGPSWTIGACNDDNVPDDQRIGWRFAGWCWTHDHFTEGKGTPVGWLPMLGTTPQPADGEAVAEWQVWHKEDGWGATHPDNVAEYRARGVPVRPLYAHPPAPVQAAPQEGEKAAATLRDALKYVGYRQDGDLNTLAERAELWMRESKVLIAMQQELAARPSAYELGVAPEMAIAASGIRSIGMYVKGWNDCREATLQHRGDSQEVGRG